MENKICLVTTTRNDLFDIAHLLSATVIAAFPRTKADSLVVALRGSHRAGKSIFADTLRRDIWGEIRKCTDVVAGDNDMYLTREFNKTKIEYNYIDIANRMDFVIPAINCLPYEMREQAFMKQRKHKGISIIQNKKEDTDCDISVWVEKPDGEIVCYDRFGYAERDIMNAEKTCRVPNSNHITAFKKAMGLNYEWARYVEIKLDPQLVERSPKIQKILTRLNAQSARIKRNLELLHRGECDIEEFRRRLMGPKYKPNM